jgi:hypothetical protein
VRSHLALSKRQNPQSARTHVEQTATYALSVRAQRHDTHLFRNENWESGAREQKVRVEKKRREEREREPSLPHCGPRLVFCTLDTKSKMQAASSTRRRQGALKSGATHFRPAESIWRETRVTRRRRVCLRKMSSTKKSECIYARWKPHVVAARHVIKTRIRLRPKPHSHPFRCTP